MLIERRSSVVVAWVILILPGCGGPGPGSEVHGEAARRLLPTGLAEVLPETVVLCHQERGPGSSAYRLWVLRDASTSYVVLPRDVQGLASREMPADSVQTWFRAKAPWVAGEVPESGMGRFTRWTRGDREYQLREVIAEGGWYATLEEMESSM